MNSWAMFDVGAEVDESFGTARMLVIYFISTITGFLASVILEPYLAVGASAALCGLIGAMVAAGMHDRSSMGSMIRGSYLRWFIWIMIISFIPGLGIAWAAHLGGF